MMATPALGTPAMMLRTPAWYDDIGVLWRDGTEFFPAKHHTERERLNAIVRLVAYASCAAFVAGGKAEVLVIGAALIAAVSLSVKFSKAPVPSASRTEVLSSSGAPDADPDDQDDQDDEDEDDDGDDDEESDDVSDYALLNWNTVRSIASEAAGTARGVGHRQRKSKGACTASTPDNPFANMLVSDLAANPSRPPACSYDTHSNLIEKHFNQGLVRNLYDVYDKENSQRQFMTMPVTTSAADVSAFARFCYGGMGRKTCKEDTAKCTGW